MVDSTNHKPYVYLNGRLGRVETCVSVKNMGRSAIGGRSTIAVLFEWTRHPLFCPWINHGGMSSGNGRVVTF